MTLGLSTEVSSRGTSPFYISELSSCIDLNSGAVLWSIEPIDQWTTAEKYRRLGRPRKVILTEDQGGPGELVEAIQFPHEMLRHPVSLCDFGLSIRSGTVVENTGQSPPLFCAPERLHRINPSFASDMWSFTCIFAKLYLGVEAIWGEGPTLVSRIIGTVGGPLPAHWKGFYGDGSTAKDWWYDQSGQMPRSSIVGGYETLEEKIDRLRPDICKRERELALSVMHKGFACAPERRITAAQLLEDPSFNALMLYYRL
jgi:serine/threonine protein kinase